MSRPEAPPSRAPARIAVYTVGGEASALWGGSAAYTLRVEDLGHGRSRVSEWSEVAGTLGVQEGAAAGITWRDRSVGIGTAASAGVLGGVGESISWVVPSDEVDDLLVSRAMEHVGGPAFGAGRSVFAALPIVGGMVYEPPAPESTGSAAFAAADVRASVKGRGTPGGSGAVAGSVVLGETVNHHTHEATYHLDGAAAAAAGLGGIDDPGSTGASGSASTSVGLVVDRHGRPVRLESRIVTTADDGIEVRDTTIDLTAPDVGAAATRLLDDVRSARLDRFDVDAALITAAAHSTTEVTRYHTSESGSLAVVLPFGSVSLSATELRRR